MQPRGFISNLLLQKKAEKVEMAGKKLDDVSIEGFADALESIFMDRFCNHLCQQRNVELNDSCVIIFTSIDK